MAKYPYISPSKNVLKPWIKVSLGYKKTHKVTPAVIVALIDSGADVCFCAKDIAIWLGVQFNKKTTAIFTAANRTKFGAIKETLTFYGCGKSYECPFYITDELPPETPIILGQIGFFDHFKVTFDYKNKEMEIV